MPHPDPDHGLQQGAVLIASLLFVLLFTILGLATMQATNLQANMASNTQDRLRTLQAAEAALRAGEHAIMQLTRPQATAALAAVSASMAGTTRIWPLGAKDWARQPAAWWSNNANTHRHAGIARDSHFVVEAQGFIADDQAGGHDYGGPAGRYVYRITAHAIGSNRGSAVILQSTIARRFE